MNEIITLLLARRIAQAYGEDESEAIFICSKNVFKTIKNQNIRNLVLQLAQKKTPKHKRIECVKRLELALRVENML